MTRQLRSWGWKEASRGGAEAGVWGNKGEERGQGGGWLTHLDEAFLEQDLYDFFEDGEQARVVHPYPPLQHG